MAGLAFTPSLLRLAQHGERLVYRIAGLPVAIGVIWASWGGSESSPLDSAFAAQFWHLQGFGDWLELAAAMLVWPIALAAASIWFTARNGPAIARREGRGVARQFADQLRLYFSAGVLAPWYYVFSLHEDSSRAHARSFLQRFQTKTCLFLLLKERKGSPLNDKARFAEYCSARGIRCVPTMVELNGPPVESGLPDCDLFVKPRTGRGGRGAERWDRVDPFSYQSGSERLPAHALLDRLVERSRLRPLLIQPRLRPHPDLTGITAGALPTARIVTCLDERGEPEVMAAMFRMSVGQNATVDNIHAGGIAAAPDIRSGRLSRSSDLGMNARLGWLSVHPDTGERIEGRVLPHWKATKRLAIRAHRSFADRVVIGWDIGILDEGPIVIEGNGNPDMDIIQRFLPVGLRNHRFGELIAFHLQQRLPSRVRAFPEAKSAPTYVLDEADGRHPHQRQANAGRAGLGPQLPPQQPRSRRVRCPDPQHERVS
ncbi:MAG TPA: sugar-transfer associated ATP-grasp domain-containing protein [Sphingomicrobium sp.]|nr:sugar-transfer associated ATP-grasp domain-containing protein [Sphingomicrobium sp.]